MKRQVAILFPIGGFLLAAWWWSISPIERAVNTLVTENLCADEYDRSIAAALPLFLTGTKYENRWQINGIAKPDYVNVYVFRGDAVAKRPEFPRLLLRAIDKCAFVGGPQVIVCDATFLDAFLNRWDGGRLPAGLIQRDKGALPIWIIGHELGHLLSGHKPRHFSEEPLAEAATANDFDQEQELAADQFCANALERNRQVEQAVRVMLLDMLTNEITTRVGDPVYGVGLTYDYDGPQEIEHEKGGRIPST